MQALAKPLEFEDEELDVEDPSNLYFIYICQKNEDMVMKKKVKENKLQQDKKKKKKKKMQAPNL